MKKSDLQNGMMVVLRNGDHAILINDGLMISPKSWPKRTWGYLKGFDDDLNFISDTGTPRGQNEHDIIAVHGSNSNADYLELEGREVLWTRS